MSDAFLTSTCVSNPFIAMPKLHQEAENKSSLKKCVTTGCPHITGHLAALE